MAILLQIGTCRFFFLLIAFVPSAFLLPGVEKGLMLMGVVSSEPVLGEECFHTEAGWVCSGSSPRG